MKISVSKRTADSHFEVEEGVSLAPEVYFPYVDGVDADHLMERSWFSSLGAKEKLIDSDEDSMERPWFSSLNVKEMLIDSESD